MKENRFYSEIMNTNESEDIKKILKSWANFSKNKPKLPYGSPIVLPDMLWIAKSGYGKTNLLRLISEYLYEENLIEFYGDVKFFEFVLEYCPKEAKFTSMDDFNDILRSAAGFRSEFKGVVCVNITEWINHINEKYFLQFLEFLSQNSDLWHIIFVVETLNDEKIKPLEACLNVYFRIDRVKFELPETEKLGVYMVEFLQKHGFSIEKSAMDILLETIDELRKGKYFDGYKTLNMICSDLIYRQFSSDNFDGYVINEETVKYYSKDSEFVSKTKVNIEKKNKIGFLYGGSSNDNK